MFPPIRHHTSQHDDLVRDPRTRSSDAPHGCSIRVVVVIIWEETQKGGSNKRNQHITSQDALHECAWYLHSIHKMDVVASIEHSPNSPTRRCSKRHQRFFKHYRPETIPHFKHRIVARRRCPDLQHSKVLQMASSVDDTLHVQIYRHAYGYKHI